MGLLLQHKSKAFQTPVLTCHPNLIVTYERGSITSPLCLEIYKILYYYASGCNNRLQNDLITVRLAVNTVEMRKVPLLANHIAATFPSMSLVADLNQLVN